MNKLAALVADRSGKRSQYREVQNATYPPSAAADSDDDGEGDGDGPHSPSSNYIPAYVLDWIVFVSQYAVPLIAVTTLVFIIAIEGNRASYEDLRPSADDIEQGSVTLYRPCQIYRRDIGGVGVFGGGRQKMLKVVQTSLGSPSNQWGQVSCTYDNPIEAAKSVVGANSNKTSHDPRELFPDGQGKSGVYYPPSATIHVDFNSGPTFPEREPILGFGGAFTEAAALNYRSLNEEGREAVLGLLFGSEGLGYSLGRVHMNSCDFCVASYNFDDVEGDFDLEHFDEDVQHDQDCGMIEMMLKADNISRTAWPLEADHGLRLVASPWSPPPWMKAPTPEDAEDAIHAENMTSSAWPSCLREGTGPDSKYAKTWALFFSKFISAYKKLGINIYAVTPQNEPEFPAPWDACAYTRKVESSFIANHLGPVLRSTHPEVKVLAFDHNKDHAPNWAELLLHKSNPASAYVDGTAVHWYAGGMDRLLDGAVGGANMHRLMSQLKHMNVSDEHLLIGSEACHCPTTGYAGGDLEVAWARAERYAHTILSDLAAGSNGWIEWNLILDAIGGPNHLGNLCDAPLLAVPYRAKGGGNITKTQPFEGAGHPFGPAIGDSFTREELNARGNPAEFVDLGVIIQPIYFYMGHISRYVRPGSRAVHALVDSSASGRAFRGQNDVVAGGGINDNARVGIEATLWPCEGSTRQYWTYSANHQLQVYGHDWLGKPTTACLGKHPDKDFQGLTLTKCNKNAGIFDIVLVDDHSSEESKASVNFVISNANHTKHNDSICLVAKPSKNGGGAYGPRGGAQVSVGKCDNGAAKWLFDKVTGEITSDHFSDENDKGGEVCMTTGWPFLQAGAFETPDAKKGKTIIILNEANEPANFVIKDAKGKDLMASSIASHSIQTVMFD